MRAARKDQELEIEQRSIIIILENQRFPQHNIYICKFHYLLVGGVNTDCEPKQRVLHTESIPLVHRQCLYFLLQSKLHKTLLEMWKALCGKISFAQMTVLVNVLFSSWFVSLKKHNSFTLLTLGGKFRVFGRTLFCGLEQTALVTLVAALICLVAESMAA